MWGKPWASQGESSGQWPYIPRCKVLQNPQFGAQLAAAEQDALNSQAPEWSGVNLPLYVIFGGARGAKDKKGTGSDDLGWPHVLAQEDVDLLWTVVNTGWWFLPHFHVAGGVQGIIVTESSAGHRLRSAQERPRQCGWETGYEWVWPVWLKTGAAMGLSWSWVLGKCLSWIKDCVFWTHSVPISLKILC